MTNHDLNWYYNMKNFPNHEGIIEPLVHYVEYTRPDRFETIDFLNLLEWHYLELQNKVEKPIDFLQHIRNLPLPGMERAMLLAGLLKMYGGIPVENKHDKYYAIRKLVEKEFLRIAGNELLPEKELCSREEKQRDLLNAEALVHADLRENDRNIPIRSRYFDKVKIDFGDISFPIVKEIVSLFDGANLGGTGADSYDIWFQRLESFLQTVPHLHQKVLQKAIEYATAAYNYHKGKECAKKGYCALDDSWERRIAIAEHLLDQSNPSKEPAEIVQEAKITINEKIISKTDFVRLINVLSEIRAFKYDDGTIPEKKELIALFGGLVDGTLQNFHPDLNKALEKSLEANIKIFDTLKSKAEDIWNKKNGK